MCDYLLGKSYTRGSQRTFFTLGKKPQETNNLSDKAETQQNVNLSSTEG